nr:hypothetical protein [Oceanicoccus sp. KOV_DT_Chl]
MLYQLHLRINIALIYGLHDIRSQCGYRGHQSGTLVNAVVEEQINMAKVINGLFVGGGNGVGIQQIHANRQGLAAQRLHLCCGGVEATGDGAGIGLKRAAFMLLAIMQGAGGDHHVKPLFGQSQCGLLANTAAGAGDKGDFVVIACGFLMHGIAPVSFHVECRCLSLIMSIRRIIKFVTTWLQIG